METPLLLKMEVVPKSVFDPEKVQVNVVDALATLAAASSTQLIINLRMVFGDPPLRPAKSMLAGKNNSIRFLSVKAIVSSPL